MSYVNWENQEDFWAKVDKVDAERQERERVELQNRLVKSEFEKFEDDFAVA